MIDSLAAFRQALFRRLQRGFSQYPALRQPQPAPTSPKAAAETRLSPPAVTTFKLGAAHLFDTGPQPWRTDAWTRPHIPSMIGLDEIDFLHYLARTQYRNRGSIIEFGPLGGASTCALAAGAPEATLHAYDFWTYHEALRDYFPGRRLRPGQSVLPAFLENIRPLRDRVRVHRGDLTRQRWASGPIEIVIRGCRQNTGFSVAHVPRILFFGLSPQGWILWQDYVSALPVPGSIWRWKNWQTILSTGIRPKVALQVVTRLKCPLPREPLPAGYFETLPLERARAHLARARDRFPRLGSA